MKPGVYFNLPAADYFKAPGVSNSMLQHLTPPARLPAYLAEPEEPTEEMILGTLAHSMILEPRKPLPCVIVPPETYPAPPDCSAVKQKKAQPGDQLPWHWSANYCKQWYAEACKEGLIVLTQDRMDTLTEVIKSVTANQLARAVLNHCFTEVSVFSPHSTQAGGVVLRKCRIDFVPWGSNCIGDLKTVQDASPVAFAKKLVDDGWAMQAAGNLDLWNAQKPDDQRDVFVFILVEKKAPYLVATYVVDSDAMRWGRERNESMLGIYEFCRESKSWPGYSDSWVAVGIPDWMKRREGVYG